MNTGRFVWCMLLVVGGALAVGAAPVQADSAASPAPTTSHRLDWWRAARFGMFVHWSPVSLLGTENSWSRGGGNTPGKAVDDNPGTRWATKACTHAAWLEVDLGRSATFDRAEIDEACGSHAQAFELQYRNGGAWKTFYRGTTIGPRWKQSFPPVTAQVVRLNILKASESPTIWEFDLFPPKKI